MNRLDSMQFKRLVKSNGVLDDSILIKSRVNKAEMVDDRKLKFIISTADVDRHQDKIYLDAWDDIKNYLKNPVVLWSHDSTQPPIAKCVDIYKDKDSLYGIAEFADRDMPVIGEFADMVLRMCKEGFINATSVGFQPTDFEETDKAERGAGTDMPGYDFHKADLMEFSIVTVPANPKALLVKSKLDQILTGQKIQLSLNKHKRRNRQLQIFGLS